MKLLTELVNKVWESEAVPGKWRQSIVPIYKGEGSRSVLQELPWLVRYLLTSSSLVSSQLSWLAGDLSGVGSLLTAPPQTES